VFQSWSLVFSWSVAVEVLDLEGVGDAVVFTDLYEFRNATPAVLLAADLQDEVNGIGCLGTYERVVEVGVGG
jgi:hypothetical protein